MSRRAVVVGSGPNGLAAAIRLSELGWKVTVLEARPTVGGGARTAELTLPGFRHDICSAIHPLGAASPYLESLPLAKYGLEWIHSPAPLAHPLPDGRVAVLERSLEETARTLENAHDAAAWVRFFRPFVERWQALSGDALGPVTTRIPKAPFLLTRFGLPALESCTGFVQSRFEGALAQALFAGCAAHSCADLDVPLTASAGLMLAIAGHAVGWPFAKGGSQAIADALAAHLKALGGEVRTGVPVRTLAELPAHDVALFDTSAEQLVALCGDALPASYRRAVSHFRRGPGVFKLDYALKEPLPWRAAACRRASTVHVGGALQELREGEKAVAQGRVPERPYVLVAQHTPFDPTRAPAGQHTAWVYCHLPNGSTADVTAQVEAQLERFAPGFRDVVLARRAMGAPDFQAYNPNYAGGDISAGAMEGRQIFFRPALRRVPYATGNPKVFLCSASTPPGPGVHGLCGFFAAEAVQQAFPPGRAS